MRLSRQQIALSGPGKGDNISLVRKAELNLTNGFGKETGATNQQFWKPYIIGNYIYWASGTDGIIVFHISDDGDLTWVNRVPMRNVAGDVTSFDARSCTHIGDTLFVTAWKFSVGGPVFEGLIAAYDIGADPTTPAWISTLEGIPYGTGDKAWLQDAVTDGELIYVAAQYSGLHVIDPDLAGGSLNMVEHGAGAHGSAGWPPTYWEASNITMANDNKSVALSNHGTGAVAVTLINIENPAVPVVTKRLKPYTAPNGDPLRVRSVDIYGDYLYCSPNSDGEYLNSSYRGLQALDISDLSAIDEDNPAWVQVPIALADQENTYEDGDNGDPACVGVYKYGYFAFVSNGRNGVAVYNVKDPTAPVYLGILTGELQDPTNIYHAYPFYLNGKSYLLYGTGPEDINNHTVYLDQIVIK